MQAGRESHFARETFCAQPVSELGSDDLDHHGAAERGFLRHEHARHSAACQLAFERIGAAEGSLKFRAKVGHFMGAAVA